MAMDDQKVLLARQAELQADLMRAQATDFTDAPQDTAGIGSIVDLKDLGSGETFKYTILGAWDSDPENNIYLTLPHWAKVCLARNRARKYKLI